VIVSKAEALFLGAAILVHAGGIGIASTLPAIDWLAALDKKPLDVVEVEIDLPTWKENPERRASVETRPAPRMGERIDERTDPSRPFRPEDRDRAASPGDVDVDPGAPTGPGEVVMGPGGPGDDWSVPPGDEGGGWGPTGPARPPIWMQPGIMRFGEPSPAAATTAPKAPKADRDIANKVVNEELRKKDKKLGLDLPAAGTVASLVKSAVWASDTPTTSAATILVTLGPTGKVKTVRVMSFAGGDNASWQAIAATVKSSLAARQLNLTEMYEKGAAITVNVQSKVKMPSGSEVGAGLELSLTQSFDVSDIGAKPIRLVTASFSASPIK
jgi:hypothetical protein